MKLYKFGAGGERIEQIRQVIVNNNIQNNDTSNDENN